MTRENNLFASCPVTDILHSPACFETKCVSDVNFHNSVNEPTTIPLGHLIERNLSCLTVFLYGIVHGTPYNFWWLGEVVFQTMLFNFLRWNLKVSLIKCHVWDQYLGFSCKPWCGICSCLIHLECYGVKHSKEYP